MTAVLIPSASASAGAGAGASMPPPVGPGASFPQPPALPGDHAWTVRRAVAAALPAHQPRLRARILAGEADHLALVAAAMAAAGAVLEGLWQ